YCQNPLTSRIHTLSLHDALPICWRSDLVVRQNGPEPQGAPGIHYQPQTAISGVRIVEACFDLLPRHLPALTGLCAPHGDRAARLDRKSTRLNSSHVSISYAVFCF